jgi:hypothetical protein
MLPKVLLAAVLGAQVVAGAVIAQQDSTPVEAFEVVQGDHWSYEDCGTCFLQRICRTQAINGISYLFFFPATGGPDDIIELQSISISPEPPKPGQDLEITAKGRVKQTLEVCGLCCL